MRPEMIPCTLLRIVGVDADAPDVQDLADPDRTSGPPSPDLVSSIGFYGVQSPILISLWGEGPDTQILVVDGRQRVLAARAASKLLGGAPIEVPCVLRPDVGDDTGHPLALAMILANEGRRTDPPLARARKVDRLMSYGMKAVDCAMVLHTSKATIHNLRSLLRLVPEAQAMVDSGEIPLATAYTMASKTPAEQRRLVATFRAAPEAARGDRGVEAARGEDADPDGDTPPPPKITDGLGRRVLRRLMADLAPPGPAGRAGKDWPDDRDEPTRIAHALIQIVLGERGLFVLDSWPDLQAQVRDSVKPGEKETDSDSEGEVETV